MDRVIEHMQQALGAGPGVVAFDADGTLWSGDVGEDFFLFCVREGALKAEAGEALHALAQRFQIAEESDPNRQALVLYEAYLADKLPEREVCEMMAWALAGHAQDDLTGLIRRALDEAGLHRRRYRPIERAIAWAREHELVTLVISASPSYVVAAAAESLGFSTSQIAACEPGIANGILLPHLAHPLPYAEHKVSAAARLAPGVSLLAAFGDNSFDLAMLDAARVRVAVNPKPALRELLVSRTDVITIG